MEQKYKEYELELDLPENWFVINPSKYNDLNLKSIEQMELIDAFAVKENDTYNNVVSFYHVEDFDFDKITLDIGIEKINDTFSLDNDEILIKETFDYVFKKGRGLVVYLSSGAYEEIYLMQVYFEHKGNVFCFNLYSKNIPCDLEELENDELFTKIKELINENKNVIA